MAKKDITKEHLEVIKRHGLNPALYVVQRELPESLIVRNWITGEFRVIEKGGRK